MGGGSKDTEITLRVEETIREWKKAEGKIVWQNGQKIGNQGLDKWQFGYKNDTELDFMYPAIEWGILKNKKANCAIKDSKIKPTDSTVRKGFGDGVPLPAEDVKLSLETNNCQHNFSNVVCEITINSSNKLKWVEGKQPKIIYTPFK